MRNARRHAQMLRRSSGLVFLAGLMIAASACSRSREPREHSTTLHEAAGKGDLAEVERLLDEGADVNIKDEGGATPLHAAAFGGHRDVIRLLMARGADVNAQDNDGDTPLGFAADTATAKVLKGKRTGRP